MCEFFSFITEPEHHGGKRFYFDWDYRKSHLGHHNHDSHSSIAKYYKLDEDNCNKYEYNPFTRQFKVDQINSSIDDSIQAEDWVKRLDFKRIIEPLIITPIFNPLSYPIITVTEEHIQLLNQWALFCDSVWDSVCYSVWDSVGFSVRNSVRFSVRDSVYNSVRDSVRFSVRDSVYNSVRDSVGDSVLDLVWASIRDSVEDSVLDLVWASVRDLVWAYISTFIDIEYKHDFSPAVKLWKQGIVPSYDGTTWRLHSGPHMKIVYELKPTK